jgi:DNA polymerase III epsilon subunit-like protein
MFFFLDTETTGQQGLPLWHPKNRLLQVAIVYVNGEKKEFFNRYVKYEDDFFIPEESTKIHKITNLTIQEHGLNPKQVLQEMLEWVQKRSSKPEIYAHNAQFDRNVLRIAIFRELGESYGEGGKEWSWKWYCTMKAARDLFPEIGKEYWPEDKPYSLGKLQSYFNEKGTLLKNLHNAMIDVQVLCELYLNAILPKVKDISLYSIPAQISRLTPITKIPGYALKRAMKLQRALQTEFFNEGISGDEFDYSEFACSPTMLTVGHLLVYGKMRYEQKIRRKTIMQEPITLQDQCTWYEIASSIEVLLRVGLNMTSESTMAELIAHVCDRDIVDLCFHTAREDGTLHFFPTMRGQPVSFLPLKISAKEAKSLRDLKGWGTIGELANEMQTRSPYQRREFFREVYSCIEGDANRITGLKLEETLQDVIKYSS